MTNTRLEALKKSTVAGGAGADSAGADGAGADGAGGADGEGASSSVEVKVESWDTAYLIRILKEQDYKIDQVPTSTIYT